VALDIGLTAVISPASRRAPIRFPTTNVTDRAGDRADAPLSHEKLDRNAEASDDNDRPKHWCWEFATDLRPELTADG
jgi:hypothetical protein